MLRYPLVKFQVPSLVLFFNFFIYIFGTLGLEKTNIPARYGDDKSFLSNGH